jgi:hypothetical protein
VRPLPVEAVRAAADDAATSERLQNRFHRRNSGKLDRY